MKSQFLVSKEQFPTCLIQFYPVDSRVVRDCSQCYAEYQVNCNTRGLGKPFQLNQALQNSWRLKFDLFAFTAKLKVIEPKNAEKSV